jgi:hypothetical protein
MGSGVGSLSRNKFIKHLIFNAFTKEGPRGNLSLGIGLWLALAMVCSGNLKYLKEI